MGHVGGCRGSRGCSIRVLGRRNACWDTADIERLYREDQHGAGGGGLGGKRDPSFFPTLPGVNLNKKKKKNHQGSQGDWKT